VNSPALQEDFSTHNTDSFDFNKHHNLDLPVLEDPPSYSLSNMPESGLVGSNQQLSEGARLDRFVVQQQTSI
jgi:hypothetical protein